MNGLTENTEALRKAQRLAAEYAKETDNMDVTVEALIVNIKDVNERAHLISESLRDLIGGKPTEDKIADPVPDPVPERPEQVAFGKEWSDKDKKWVWPQNVIETESEKFAPSDMTGGETDYAPDPEDKEGGAQ